MKSDSAKQAAIDLQAYIDANQPNFFKRVFCCAKPFTGDEEEDEELESIIYSSGEDDGEENKLGI
jgi:hypothetical protein